MSQRKTFSIGNELYNVILDHIRLRRDNEAKSLLNENFAKSWNEMGTLLHYAAFHGNETIAQRLLELGSEVDPVQISFGRETPLMLAVKYGHTAVVRVLLDADANIDAMNATGKTVPQMVFDQQYFNPQIAEAFLRKMQSKFRATKDFVGSLLHTACTIFHVTYLRDIDVMNCMLKRGFGVLARGPRGLTPLHAAVEVNDLKLAEWLMAKGADVNALDEDGKTPLLTAALHGKTEMMQFLLDRGAKPIIQCFGF